MQEVVGSQLFWPERGLQVPQIGGKGGEVVGFAGIARVVEVRRVVRRERTVGVFILFW